MALDPYSQESLRCYPIDLSPNNTLTQVTTHDPQSVKSVITADPRQFNDICIPASESTQNDGQRGDYADVKHKGAELVCHTVLDLKQEADLDVHPVAFKPLQLASLVDPKHLETLEGMGGVGALLHGLGIDDLDIPQIAVVGVPDDSNPSLALPSPSLDSSRLPPSPSPSGIHSFLSPQPPF